jgi:hypothetical protein
MKGVDVPVSKVGLTRYLVHHYQLLGSINMHAMVAIDSSTRQYSTASAIITRLATGCGRQTARIMGGSRPLKVVFASHHSACEHLCESAGFCVLVSGFVRMTHGG